MEYVPFGEVFLEEKNAVWNTPFLFNGKELDKETGMSYYGARYYEPKTSVWISVDPLAEKTMSSYGYCYNNPVNLIDPTGMSAEGIEPNRKAKENEIAFDPTDETTYRGNNDGTWTEATKLDDVKVNSSHQTNPFTPFDDTNNLLTIAMNTSGALIPLSKYTEALSNGKFIFNYNGVDKLWKMGYYGGGNGKIASSLIESAKIETQVLGSVGNGLKFGGYGLSALGVLSTERQYQLGYINNDRRVYDQSLNTINICFPEFALGTIPGNYLGQKYHTQIMNQVTNPNAFLNSTVGSVLNFFGVPTSKE